MALKPDHEAAPLAGQLLEAWRTNNRINLFLIDNISSDGMAATLSTRGGRDVVRQFAHMQNVRVWQLERWARDLAGGLRKFETQERPSKPVLEAALEASAAAVEGFIEECATGSRSRQGMRRGLAVSIAYLISHESHHRGSILLTLKQSGHKLDQKTQYAIWQFWGEA